jgi:phosphoribosyl 1,2-cyclic phosphodiesterase
VGWGHSAIDHAFDFAELADVARLVPFHHDPSHTDVDLDRLIAATIDEHCPSFAVTPGVAGAIIQIGNGSREQDG